MVLSGVQRATVSECTQPIVARPSEKEAIALAAEHTLRDSDQAVGAWPDF
jgi:hypothetical protein